MNSDGVTNFEITTGAAGIDTGRCNFMYGQIFGCMNRCDRDKGHYGHHHDSRAGVSWTDTFTFVVTSTSHAP